MSRISKRKGILLNGNESRTSPKRNKSQEFENNEEPRWIKGIGTVCNLRYFQGSFTRKLRNKQLEYNISVITVNYFT